MGILPESGGCSAFKAGRELRILRKRYGRPAKHTRAVGVHRHCAWLISENRRAAKLRVAVVGIGLQLLIATVLLKVGPARFFFIALNEAVYALERATVAGTSFVFGYRGGGALPFEVTAAGSSFVLAFRSLPLILVVSALTAWRRSQAPWTLQRGLGWCMAPVAWLMGVPWVEAPSAGSLLGIKTVLNELLA